uniref:Uncharacterized protein n=1 Tax=Cacopsylla melanoneura TaxID=428564 RepID=A0A8D9AS00_9HEMI
MEQGIDTRHFSIHKTIYKFCQDLSRFQAHVRLPFLLYKKHVIVHFNILRTFSVKANNASSRGGKLQPSRYHKIRIYQVGYLAHENVLSSNSLMFLNLPFFITINIVLD